MRPFLNDNPHAGLTYFDRKSTTPDDGYLIARDHIVIELCRDGRYLDFYVTPGPGGTCNFMIHLPELSVIDEAKADKAQLLRLMGASKLFAKIMKNSLEHRSGDDYTFVRVADFTAPALRRSEWCARLVTGLPYNKVIFDENAPEGRFAGQVLSELSMIAEDFYGVLHSYRTDAANKEWIVKSRFKKLSAVAKTVHENSACAFGYGRPLETVKKMLDKEGYLLWTDSGVLYPFDVPVPAHDRNKSGLLIRADLFFPELKKYDFIYFVTLTPEAEGKWQASICFDPDQMKLIDTLLRDFTTRNSKIPPLSYAYMPTTAHIWANSMARPRYDDFSKYIDVVIKDDEKIASREYKDENYRQVVRSGNTLKLKAPVRIDFGTDPWSGLEPVAELLFYGMVVSHEVHGVTQNLDTMVQQARRRRSQQWAELFTGALRVAAKLSRFS